MNTRVHTAPACRERPERPAPGPARRPDAEVALLGTGTVGRAVLARLAQWSRDGGGGRLSLVYAANSRTAVRLGPASRARATGAGEPAFAALLPEGPGRHVLASDLDAVRDAFRGHGARIVIDATACAAVADQHPRWLARGIHVVTACKIAQGTSLPRWRAVREACARGGTRYGDSATVGAGLPLLRSLRALQAGGDRIHGIAGVLSGSLAWLFNHYDGMRPFSALVRQAREAGYTEPDPRDDLSGEDVRRKLLILARASGVALEADRVEVESLVPGALAGLAGSDVDAALPALDAPLRARYADAWKRGARLRFIARLDAGRARVGLEALSADDPLAGGSGTDNRVAIWSDRYAAQPLVIQGPGAGASVTAAALLDDALEIGAGA